MKNGAILSQPIGQWLPNRWGLFDTYGNAKELCDMSVPPTDSQTECLDAVAPLVANDRRFQQPLIRGISTESPGTVWGFSHCRTDRIVDGTDPTVGLRLARTLFK